VLTWTMSMGFAVIRDFCSAEIEDTEVGSFNTVNGTIAVVLMFSLGDRISRVPLWSVEVNSSIGVIAYWLLGLNVVVEASYFSVVVDYLLATMFLTT
jgi:hypothetical protein